MADQIPPPITPGGPAPAQSMPINVQEIVQTALRVLTKPVEFWETVRDEAGFQKMLIFAVAMGLVGGVVAGVVGFLGLAIHGLVGMAFGALVTSIIVYPIVAVLGVFIGGAIIHVIALIGGGKASYEVSARIAAYGMAILPVSAAVGILSVVSLTLSSLAALAPGLYGLYIIVLGIIALHAADRQRTFIVGAVLAGLVVLATIASLIAARAVTSFGSHAVPALQDFAREAQKGGADMKEMEKALRELQKQMGNQ